MRPLERDLELLESLMRLTAHWFDNLEAGAVVITGLNPRGLAVYTTTIHRNPRL